MPHSKNASLFSANLHDRATHHSLSSPLSDRIVHLTPRITTRAGLGDKAGDTLATAKVLRSTPGPVQSFTDTVGSNDPDIYRIDVPLAQVRGTVSGRNLSNKPITISVLKRNGTFAPGTRPLTLPPSARFNQSFQGVLLPGTYYIKLTSSGINNRYTVALTINP